MLFLTRRVGEKITIGDDIVVVVTKIRGDVVEIGINAPKDMQVLRHDARLKRPRENHGNS